MLPTSDEESHRLTRAPAVSAHYPAPSSSNIAGSQLTLASLRHEFWILRARATIRFVLYKCTRVHADVPVELMGDLPAARLNRTARAFIHISVDYVRSLSGRFPVEGINRLHHFIYHIPHNQSSTLRARQRLYLSYLYRSVSMLCFSPRTTDIQ